MYFTSNFWKVQGGDKFSSRYKILINYFQTFTYYIKEGTAARGDGRIHQTSGTGACLREADRPSVFTLEIDFTSGALRGAVFDQAFPGRAATVPARVGTTGAGSVERALDAAVGGHAFCGHGTLRPRDAVLPIGTSIPFVVRIEVTVTLSISATGGGYAGRAAGHTVFIIRTTARDDLVSALPSCDHARIARADVFVAAVGHSTRFAAARLTGLDTVAGIVVATAGSVGLVVEHTYVVLTRGVLAGTRVAEMRMAGEWCHDRAELLLGPVVDTRRDDAHEPHEQGHPADGKKNGHGLLLSCPVIPRE